MMATVLLYVLIGILLVLAMGNGIGAVQGMRTNATHTDIGMHVVGLLVFLGISFGLAWGFGL